MILYRVARVLSNLIFPLIFRLRFEGKEHLPSSGGYIMASNHVSLFDPLFVAMAMPTQVHFMAKAELFRNPLLGWLLKGLGAFPVERGKGDSGALDHSVNILRQGGTLGIFPEGTRSKDGNPLRPKSGAALIAKMTGADVLPCGIEVQGKVRLWSKITVRFGPMIPHEQLGFTDESPSQIKRATKRIWGEVLTLCGREETPIED